MTHEFEVEPSWGPLGGLIAIGTSDPETEDEGAIELINPESGAHSAWLLNKDGPYEYEPEWTPGGGYVTYSRWNEEAEPNESNEIGLITVGGTEEQYILEEFTWAQSFKPQETTGGIEYDPSELLAHYEPRLHYDMQEQYFADSAAEATDGPENRILASDKETVVRAHEMPFEVPTMESLEEEETANGYIDEGGEVEEDAATMHAGEWGNKAYGRAHYDAEAEDWWLQYWFYYYYNDQEVLGAGVHEGDWETVALHLDASLIPDYAIYSRHASESGTCDVQAISWEASDGDTVSPVVYVANGSHANYFAAGTFNRGFPLPDDDANGDGAEITPAIQAVSDIEAVPGWFHWSGRWGTSEGGLPWETDSPESPPEQGDRWNDLAAFAESGVENCEVEYPASFRASRRQDESPDAPTISAQRTGQSIVVRYRIPQSGVKSRYLRLTVSARDQRDATRTEIVKLRGRAGRATLPLPLAAGPYVAAASSYSDDRERSDTVSTPVSE